MRAVGGGSGSILGLGRLQIPYRRVGHVLWSPLAPCARCIGSHVLCGDASFEKLLVVGISHVGMADIALGKRGTVTWQLAWRYFQGGYGRSVWVLPVSKDYVLVDS